MRNASMAKADRMDSLYSYFRKVVKIAPEKTALIVEDVEITYSELLSQSDSLASGFKALGIEKGDHVAVVLPNGFEFVLTMLAAAKLGVVIVPYHLSFPIKQYQASFANTKIKHLIIWHAILSDLTSSDYVDLEQLQRVICVGGQLDGWANFSDAIMQHKHLPISYSASESVDPKTPFIITLTSGSTGNPKPIVLSQEIKILRAKQAIQLYSVTSKDVIQVATPLYHSLAERLVFVALLSGACCVLMPHFSAKEWVKKARFYATSFSILVSSQLKQIIPIASAEPLSSLRCLVSSSELLDIVTRKRLVESFSCEIHECYGTSEVAIASNLCLRSSKEYSADLSLNRSKGISQSIGKAVSGTVIRVVDNSGNELSNGEVGEIVCTAKTAFLGYLNDTRMTNEKFFGCFFRTGDMGKFDQQGFLYFIGRESDIIISGGINIYPKDIEDAVLLSNTVSEVCVVPKVDKMLGEVPIALIVKHPNYDLDKKELRVLCATELADYQQPRDFILVDNLIKNEVGKIDRKNIIREFESSQLIAL